ncbi:MAG: preprotein translocase subunit SecY, partial [Actinobacteria bacterium]|nr:preprotein translocase subunit SecY [Actinomycetota bacterium]
MLKALINAFRVPDLRKKILFTLGIIVLYRIGSYIPCPGIPFQGLVNAFQSTTSGAMALMNLFSGGALSYVSVFSLGIMPYITASIIMQLMQGVIPVLGRWAREGEAGQKKVTQITRYLTLILALINAIGYLALFTSSAFGIQFSSEGLPGIWFTYLVIIITLVAGTAFIMWMGELITQRGVGNGMSLIIFANVVAGFPPAIFSSLELSANGIAITVLILICVLLVIPCIVIVERGQRSRVGAANDIQ